MLPVPLSEGAEPPSDLTSLLDMTPPTLNLPEGFDDTSPTVGDIVNSLGGSLTTGQSQAIDLKQMELAFSGPLGSIAGYQQIAQSAMVDPLLEAPEPNPPGTDWEYKDSMENWDILSDHASEDAIKAAETRQDAVNSSFEAYKDHGVKFTKTPTTSVDEEGESYTGNVGGVSVTFSDRNNDGMMDEATAIVHGETIANYGGVSDDFHHGVGWVPNYRIFVLPAPPKPNQ